MLKFYGMKERERERERANEREREREEKPERGNKGEKEESENFGRLVVVRVFVTRYNQPCIHRISITLKGVGEKEKLELGDATGVMKSGECDLLLTLVFANRGEEFLDLFADFTATSYIHYIYMLIKIYANDFK